jgi:dipeptidyl aminopeptidase/acylaminoacyl peptidase
MPRLRRSIGLAAAVVVVASLAASSPASAQYFGQNKVHYDRFDFQILATEHFDIYYYPAEADAAQMVGRMSERWYARLSQLLGHQLSSRQPVVLYASHPEFEQTNVIEGLISESTGGVTEGSQRRVVLPLAASMGDTDHVLGHELVHAFQYDILGPNIQAAPLWFIEGMAEYLSVGPRDAHTAMWLRDAALEDRLPAINDLYNPRFFPYRFGHALWAYIGGRWGDAAVGGILARLAPVPGSPRGALDPVTAIETTTKLSAEELSADWHAAIRSQYDVSARPKPENDADETRTPSEGMTLIAERAGDGSVNVGPALSPDGTRVAFLSERSRLSIDVYVADTATGEVLRQLTRTAVDPHFESLQFLASSGSWAPDNRRLAVATVQRGRGAIAIFDTHNGDIVANIRLESPGEIFHPAWSPDGNSIAYSAQIGGVTDLFVHDLTTSQTRRLTTDAFADLQPAWSPDGRRLVVVTDRGSSTIDELDFGDYGLAIVDVATGGIAPIETALDGNVTSPQWSPDGNQLFFVSDASGRPDVYRVSAAGGAAQPLTAEETGVSGITPLSLALSVARQSGHRAFNVFRNGGYELHIVAPDAATPVSRPGEVAAPRADLALLPPARRETSAVAQQLARTTQGLPAATTFEARDYSSSLSLAGVGQGVGVSTGGAFGTYVNGGISMLFSDVLGNHLVPLSFGVNGRIRDISAQAGYINRTRRWNWGVFAEHVPLRSGFVEAGLDTIQGQPVYVERTELLRETSTQAGAMLAYPISRATRIEFGSSIRRIGFGRERQTLIFDAISGAFLSEQTEDLGGLPSLALADISASLVRDSTAMGAVGPILGQRFRFEVAPTFGDLRMTTATMDFRQYAMPLRPVTFAGRLLHVGRYGDGGEDSRLFPLFLGYSTLVRGYDPGSFDASECTLVEGGSCAEFDRLSGSRILVFNGEVRVPLGGLFTGNLDYGPIPAEIFGFFDAGTAWTRAERPDFAGGTRPWVTTAGFGARVNAFGYAVVELNMARPIQRPEQGWMFVFNLRPAF